MANSNSNIYTGQIASPPTRFDVGELGGRNRIIIGNVAIADGDFDADGDTVKLCALPSNSRVTSIRIANDDLDAGTDSDVDIGIYTHQGAVIDEDEFATGVTAFRAAVTVLTEYLGTGIGAAELNMEEALWERAGASSDPGGFYDIVISQTAAVTTDAAGDLAFVVEYTVD